MINVAVIGCGRMGKIRAQLACELGANLIAAYDSNLTVLDAFKDLHPHVMKTRNIEEVPWENLDAVFVCTPPGSRSEILKYILVNNIPVFFEKPLCLNKDSFLEEFSRYASDQSFPCVVGYMNRYRSSVDFLRNCLTNEEIIGCSLYWVVSSYKVSWWKNKNDSGGPLNEQATHLIDLCRYLMGEIREVFALSTTSESPTAILLRFKNGYLGTFLYSCDNSEKDIEFKVFTHKRAYTLKGWDFNLINTDPSETFLFNNNPSNIFEVETQAFINAVISKDWSTIRSTLADALISQGVVDAIRKSIAIGQPVVLDK